MKNLILLFVAVGFSLTASAQFGLKAGLNLANANIKGGGIELDTKMKPTFHIGPTYEASLTENLALNTSLLLSGRGYKLEIDLGIGDPIESKASLYYLQLPVLLTYKTEKFYVGAGPYAGYAISAKGKSGDETNDIEIGNSVDDGLSPLDFGANVEAGIILNNIRVGLGYSLGLSDTTPKDARMDDFSAKNNAITLGANYMF